MTVHLLPEVTVNEATANSTLKNSDLALLCAILPGEL